MRAENIEVSVVIPVKDEAGNVSALAREVSRVFSTRSWLWECIWVDDASVDGTLMKLKEICARDPRHRYLSLRANRGKSTALWAGFMEAHGNLVATLDGDGQNPAADLPAMIDVIRAGEADWVCGLRSGRRDSTLRRLSSWIGNRFREALTGRCVRDSGCGAQAFRRWCLEALPRFQGMHRFLPTLASLEGCRVREMPVAHRPRYRGRAKYGIRNRLGVGFVDALGVRWLQKRRISYEIAEKSGETREPR